MRQTMIDLALYGNGKYKDKLHQSVRDSLHTLAQVRRAANKCCVRLVAYPCRCIVAVHSAQVGGGMLPLCVVSHGFGATLAIDVFTRLQLEHESGKDPGDTTMLERGLTLSFMGTIGCPHPLVVAGSLEQVAAPLDCRLTVPTPHVLERWPHLRGGWSNFYHKDDPTSFPIQPATLSAVEDIECQRRWHGEESIQNNYFVDLAECVGSVAHSLSCVWQDTNRTTTAAT